MSEQNYIVRMPEVRKMMGGVCKETIYLWIRNGTFPRPIRLGPRAVGWRKGDVLKHIESLPEAEITEFQ